MEFRVLGSIEVGGPLRTATPPGGKERAVLARLLLDPGRSVPVDALLDAVWDDAPRDAAARSLSVRIARLRGFLEPDRDPGAPPGVLVRDAGGYRLQVAPEQVDAHRFEAQVTAAADLPDAARLEALDAALALWRGPAYADVSGREFARPEIRRLEALRAHAEETRARCLVDVGREPEAIPELERLLARDPLREELARTLMLALYRAGRQVDALAAYRTLASALGELGLQPVAETRELEQAILRQEPRLVEAGGGAAPAIARRPPGREDVLSALHEELTCALGGERRVALLSGEAGAGKSVAVDAFLAEATGRERLLVGVGQCVEHSGAGEPYQPVLDALSAVERGPTADRDALVEALLARAPTWLAELPWLIPDGREAEVERRTHGSTRERMLRELLEALEILGEHAPVVLVLEDLHWSDDATLDLLAALARRRAPARLLVVGTVRPGDAPAARLTSALGVLRPCRLVAVPALDPAAVAEIVRARVPGAEDAEIERIAERSGGNALFVRHLVDALDDGAGEAEALPASLHAYLDAELRTLEAEDLALLRAASAAGRSVDAETVAVAVDRPEAEVAARLDALAAHGRILVRDSEGDRFAHGVHREVLYGQIPAEQRAALHRRIGAHLEQREPPAAARAAELAWHFVAGDDPERAVRFLQLAADGAFGRNGYPEGIAHLRAALDAAALLADDLDRTRWEVELSAQLGQAIVAVEGWSSPEAEAALLRARELAPRLRDNEPVISVLLALATLYEVRGELIAAQEMAEECLRLAPGSSLDHGLESTELLACNLFHQGSFARALEHAERGVALFESGGAGGDYSTFPATLGDNAGVSCHDWAGLALWFLGFPDQALARAERALALADDPARAHSLATARAQLAIVHACRREPEQALRWAQATIAVGTELGYAYRVAMGRVLRGWALAQLGDHDAGIEELIGGIDAARATGAHMDDPHFLGLLADAYAAAGEHPSARATADEALHVAAREHALFYAPELHRIRAAALGAEGDAAGAERELQAGLALARRHGALAFELRLATSLLELSGDAGPAAGARRALTRCLARFEEGFGTPDLLVAAALLDGTAVVAR